MDARSRALEQIASLAREHQLTALEIGAALDQPTTPSGEGRARSVIGRAVAYLGGTFIFAGLAAFIALQWDSMNSAARVIITLGPGVVAFVLATLFVRDARFDKAVAPLYLIAAALEPVGMLVAFNEFGSGGDPRLAALITTGAVGLQFGAAFAAVRRSTPLFMTVFFAVLFWLTTFDLLDADDDIVALALGGSLLLTAIGVDRTPHNAITPPWYLFGAFAFLYGLFDVVEGTLIEVLFIMVACGFVYLSAMLHSRTLLLAATLAILAYTGWFTGRHFADSVGWPIALMVLGLLMIGLSALAFRIDRRYVRNR